MSLLPAARQVADRTSSLDLRMPALALAAWSGGLLAAAGVRVAAVGLGVALTVGTALLLRTRGVVPIVLAAVAAGVALIGLAGAHSRDHGPVADLAEERAIATLTLRITSDPRTLHGRFGERTLLRADVLALTGRGHSWRLQTPVVLIADPVWNQVSLGETVQTLARLAPADGDAAALVTPRGDPQTRAPPDVWWRVSGVLRAAIRDAVAERPADQRALVPALVDGDDAAVDPALADDFRTSGLTHLLAVSGTNLTLVVGFLLAIARWVGVRGRWLMPLGLLGIAGFVLLARTEPSVVRAAAMGAVGLLAFDAPGREKAVRALGVAVVVLLLVQPELAISAGFALSVLATAGILLLAPRWAEALGRWLPRWLAEAIAVPTAAQVACTPIVAALSGQVSLVAVVANLLVAPVVGPATVLGLTGGLAALIWLPAGHLLGTGAGWCVGWIVVVARTSADLPGAAVGWGTGWLALTLLTVATAAFAVAGPRLLGASRPRRVPSTPLVAGVVTLVLIATLALVVLRPRTAWPPPGWVLVACDVGQGDGLVVATGQEQAVVVDTGPDPDAMEGCLDDLGVQTISAVVLTHFHADHAGGLDGVLDSRPVGEVLTTTLDEPAASAAKVRADAAARGVPVRALTAGESWTAGRATFEVLRPPDPLEAPGSGSAANNASVVLLAQVDGVRMLLTGDVEPEGQEQLAAAYPTLGVDVLKLPHHGSAHQDLDLLTSLGARLVLVSVGADNDYGHPNPGVIDALEDTGARVLRTDEDGDLAVVVDSVGRLSSVTR